LTNYISIPVSGISGCFADSKSQQVEGGCEFFGKLQRAAWAVSRSFVWQNSGDGESQRFVQCLTIDIGRTLNQVRIDSKLATMI